MNYLLKNKEVLTLIGKARLESVWVKSGRVWLTKEGDSRDYCLSAGSRLPLGGARLVVLEALEDAALSVVVAGQEHSGGVRLTLALSAPGGR
ncbi:hypothetical protein GMST_16090 [Geomonas silvestris]|uniref:DUF2917 domain-containing protein n=1 Tax=Geomonas silvestris TaxID=2740184 RepID=A0A6V8MHA4_9BACT|nr:DUF2917 domain-containing protein [Geomonas silvestris]GFO59284.1 hypothetical protein GMST_16090 [Geomonas silvestris]